MRCSKHPADQSGSVGVCASCLRERLLTVIAAQARGQVSFPRSVSPYISRRKSDAAAAACRPQAEHHHHHLFYRTPQVGTNASIEVEINSNKKSRFSSLFWGIFRSKPEKKDAGPGPVSHPAVSIHSSSASPAWLPSITSSRRKKKVSTVSIDESVIRTSRNRGRGLSPEREADRDDEYCWGASSGHSSDSQGWRQTPRRTPSSARRGGGRAAAQSKSVSGLTFCLSPMVRPSPSRHWNQKAAPPEAAVAGDPRTAPKPQLSATALFRNNRSRKLVDLGRYSYDPTY